MLMMIIIILLWHRVVSPDWRKRYFNMMPWHSEGRSGLILQQVFVTFWDDYETKITMFQYLSFIYHKKRKEKVTRNAKNANQPFSWSANIETFPKLLMCQGPGKEECETNLLNVTVLRRIHLSFCSYFCNKIFLLFSFFYIYIYIVVFDLKIRKILSWLHYPEISVSCGDMSADWTSHVMWSRTQVRAAVRRTILKWGNHFNPHFNW